MPGRLPDGKVPGQVPGQCSGTGFRDSKRFRGKFRSTRFRPKFRAGLQGSSGTGIMTDDR